MVASRIFQARVVGWTAVLLVALGPGTAVRVAAQGDASAVVSGVAADAQGGVLPGVTVTLRNIESGTVRTAVTEADGRYRMAGLGLERSRIMRPPARRLSSRPRSGARVWGGAH